jgi:hypothetical protein
MRWYVSIGAVLVAGAIAGGDVAGIAAPNAVNQSSARSAEKENAATVDVELVLAVDVSYSMDLDELAVQREGYAQAIVSKQFLQALKSLPNGKISITYFEWAASSDQKIIIPWRVIDGPETADAVADEILKTPIRRASRTSISGAIYFALPLFEANPYRGLRQVIDISGDGPNNNGAPILPAREAALAKGITINGLPIMVKEPSLSTRGRERAARFLPDRGKDLAGSVGAVSAGERHSYPPLGEGKQSVPAKIVQRARAGYRANRATSSTCGVCRN